MLHRQIISLFFFFNDTATTEIYTLSLHDALPIYLCYCLLCRSHARCGAKSPKTARLRSPDDRYVRGLLRSDSVLDRKSTRLNSSHSQISYAVFCLKKKKKKIIYSCYVIILISIIISVHHTEGCILH